MHSAVHAQIFPPCTVACRAGKIFYLDSGATSHKPQVVIDAVDRRRRIPTVPSNAAPTNSPPKQRSPTSAARDAHLVSAEAEEIVWTKNSTEALNFIAYALDDISRGRGESVIRGGRHRAERLRARQERMVNSERATILWSPVPNTMPISSRGKICAYAQARMR